MIYAWRPTRDTAWRIERDGRFIAAVVAPNHPEALRIAALIFPGEPIDSPEVSRAGESGGIDTPPRAATCPIAGDGTDLTAS